MDHRHGDSGEARRRPEEGRLHHRQAPAIFESREEGERQLEELLLLQEEVLNPTFP